MNSSILDLSAEMLEVGKARAVENTSISAQIIADTIADEYDVRFVGSLETFLSRQQQLKKAVYNARAEEFGDAYCIIKAFPLAFAADDDSRMFFAFDCTLAFDDKLQRMVGWANPDLLFLAKGNGSRNLFVDCTFKCVVKGFSHLMIIMIFEECTKLYLQFSTVVQCLFLCDR